MSSLKVAHITTIDLSLRFLLLNQLRSLQAAGYEVVGISASGPDVPVLEASGIRHIAVPMTRRFSPLPDLLSLWRLYQVMRRERFTIVHTHNPKPGLLGQVAAWMTGTPIIVNTVHGFYFHEGMKPFWRRFYITVEQIAARCSDVILSQNSEDMLTAVTTHICPPEKIKYLGNGIDIARFNRNCLSPESIVQSRAALGIPPGAPVVGFVGRLVAEKGILELLAAARQVVTQIPQTRFLIVGPLDTEKADALTPTIAADYNLADACIFTGMRQDMPEMYALMDVFVLPSHREGFPRSPMEASAMGVPCVVTDIRGCREAVTHGRNGYLTPLGDTDTLAAAILDLLTDKDKARQMGQNGRQMAEELFDEQLVFARVKAEYARLLQEKGIKPPPTLPTVTDS
ncbi:MAG TPA: glycosyltransferase family 4 protein [Chloroflexota bacterium]|nr:glycosyltransferase family 4 protein [Chloroflexota bacterium]HUM68516.1 glycosyltransferase family 4 protein [Chloroflexota bacterium]